MKHTLTLLVLFVALITQSCSNEKIENGWTRDNLQGKVLSLSEFSYEAKDRFGNIEKGKRTSPNHNKKYDENGNVTERNDYNSDGSLEVKTTYKYDENGNETEKNYYNSDGSLGDKRTHKYDENGNKTERNSYNSDGSLSKKKTYKYDKKGNEIEVNKYNSDGSLRSKYIYKYEFDEQGKWIQKIIFMDGIPEIIRERQYEYYD